MTTSVHAELTADEVIGFWRSHPLAGYDVTMSGDENAHWRSRPLTIQDAIKFLEAQKRGDNPDFLWYDFKPEPTALSELYVPLFMDVRKLIPTYEEEIERRESLAAQDYRERGDKV